MCLVVDTWRSVEDPLLVRQNREATTELTRRCCMSESSHLFLTFSRAGWGEASFGLNLAHQLRDRGDTVVFLTHENLAGLFAEAPFEHHLIGDHLGTLILPLIRETAIERSVDSIVLCDSLTGDGLLRRFGVEGPTLLKLGVPIIGIDTWDLGGRSGWIDLFGHKKMAMREWIAELPSLRPVPILRPNDRHGLCSFFPKPVKVAGKVRNHVRDGLGIAPHERALLFCTANWQQTTYDDADGDRCALTFPGLLARYLSELRSSYRLIHVGPAPLTPLQCLGERYRWLPPFSDKFDLLLGSADLLLSANISATTVSKAISSRIPVLVLGNSCHATSAQQAIDWLGERATSGVVEWLRTAAPIFPFALWPIGFHQFVVPLLANNDYMRAIKHAEWLDAPTVMSALDNLLFSSSARVELQHRQEEYACRVRMLPTAVQAFEAVLRSSKCAA